MKRTKIAAVKTLQNLGYTYNGGELWKPPLGKVPTQIMNEIKIPVNWLKEKGIGLAIGDICYYNNQRLCEYEESNKGWFDYKDNSEGVYVTQFAERENTGKQPVADWVPVVATYNNMKTDSYSDASDLDWDIQRCDSLSMLQNINAWKPNIEALNEIYLSEQNQKNVDSFLSAAREVNQINEDNKLKLTKDDIGKEFVNKFDAVFTVRLVNESNAVTENKSGGYDTCRLDGSFYDMPGGLVERHEPRWWIKDLPDADLFQGDFYLYFSHQNSWGFSRESKEIINPEVGPSYWEGSLTILSGIKMPKLTGDEWKLSKISIDELRELQKEME